MSMNDSTRLLLKATPELLEGWCGPVVSPDGEETVWWDDSHLTAVRDDLCWSDRRDVYLDLARAECRDRVARVVFAKLNPGDVPRGVSVWWMGRDTSTYDSAPRDLRLTSPPGWTHVDKRSDVTAWDGQGRAPVVGRPVAVPALAALDPNDDTRLPDGSRLVDALALHAVATEVFGG